MTGIDKQPGRLPLPARKPNYPWEEDEARARTGQGAKDAVFRPINTLRPRPPPSREPWVTAAILGAAGPYVLLALLYLGHHALDRHDPDRLQATVWYAMAAILGVGVFLSLLLRVRRRRGAWAGMTFLLSLPVAVLFGPMDYGGWRSGWVWLLYATTIVVVQQVAWLVVAVVRRHRSRSAAADAGVACLAMSGLAVALTAGFMLIDLDGQAGQAEAESTKQAPALALPAALAVLGLAAGAGRRLASPASRTGPGPSVSPTSPGPSASRGSPASRGASARARR